MSTETPALPVGTLREALPLLRRPFTPEAVKFKVQSVWPKGPSPSGCLVVSYIDARLVIERLNAVCGSGWSAAYELAVGNPKLMWCHLSVGGVTRSDVGESAKGMSKDLVSDSLKRAAVHHGVGVSLYALKQVTFNFPDSAGRVVKRGQGDKTTLALTDAGLAWLRDGYAKWLASDAGTHYGSAFDHGDVEDAGGMEVPLAVDDEPDAPPALDDERAKELHAEIGDAYAALRESNRRAMTAADFEMRLGRVSHDHAAMEAFRDTLRAQAKAAKK